MMAWTDDTTVDDEWEEQRLGALPDDLRNIAGLHQTDQLEATDPYAERFCGFAGNEGLLSISEEGDVA